MINAADYALGTKDMAQAHGVTSTTINNWANQGAFKYARKGTYKMYHEDNLQMTLGTIRGNIATLKYSEPQGVIETSTPSRVKKPAVEYQLLMAEMEEVTSRLRRIETKIHLICDALSVEVKPTQPTIGTMLNRTLNN